MANVRSANKAPIAKPAGDGIFPSTATPMAGPAMRALKVEVANAYRGKNRVALINCRVKIKALKELLHEITELDNTMFDATNSGYEDNTWRNGIDRLRKLSESKPGPKAAVKVDPATLV